jgi:multidrug efflux pump
VVFVNISALFIARPVGTTLLTLAVALVGIVAYVLLPVSPLPQVDFPTIRVQATLPGASPETMAATVATPLERMLGRIAGISEMTSQSSMGSAGIALQFDLSRNIDGAARDVQAAINAARAVLPTLPRNPGYRKMNPADAPVMVIGLSSSSLPLGDLYDLASTVFSQKLSQVFGVGQVTVGGSALPAVRVEVNPGFLHNKGLSLEKIRATLAGASVNSPKGMLDNGERQWFVGANDQLRKAADFAPLLIRSHDGAFLRLADVAEVRDSVEDIRNSGYANGNPAILLIIYKQPGANIIETVRNIRSALPTLRAWMPENTDLTIIMDRSPSITASLREVEQTLIIAMALVVLVVFLFLRNGRATYIPAVAVPVSLLGTFGIMYLFDYSLNHLSLMALTIATGFVVDDAIVVTENIVRHIENGVSPQEAALLGSREVVFTIISISLSLVAIFIPILGMGGIVGRLFREFAVTLSAAVLVSLAVSLITTPMMCSRLLRPEASVRADSGRFASAGGYSAKGAARLYACLLRFWTDAVDCIHEGYARTLPIVLRHRMLTLLVLFMTIGFNLYLYVIVPKGFFPQQDVGQIFGMIRADQGISFQTMRRKLVALMEEVRRHPAVAAVGGFTGGSQRNSGMVFISLKSLSERGQSMESVIGQLRGRLSKIPGCELVLNPVQDLRMGGRQTRAAYQYTLQSDDLELLRSWTPRIASAFEKISGMVDVNSDQETRGLQTSVVVNRDTLARFGVTQRRVDVALGLAFGQSFAATIYTGGNQYHVVMSYEPEYLESPQSLYQVYVPGIDPAIVSAVSAAGAGAGMGGNSASSLFSNDQTDMSEETLVPIAAFSTFEPSLTALSVAHQGQFTASTISFNLQPGNSLSGIQARIDEALFSLGVPEAILGGFQGTARAFASTMRDQGMLILTSLVILYVVLGVLYESLIHPLTILSTLPSAGVGAILGLMIFGAEFTVIAFIGVLLLCGIVKKNAIMMIDFAIELRRNEGLDATDAIHKACLLRFRPIMMTTMAAVGGALPLTFGSGNGAELRTPLGITIVGGLLVSQLLTLYTTPVVYIYLDRFSRGRSARLQELS